MNEHKILVSNIQSASQEVRSTLQQHSVNSVEDISEYIDELHRQNPDILLLLGSVGDIEQEEQLRIAQNQDRGFYKMVFRKRWAKQDVIAFKNKYAVDVFLDSDNLHELSGYLQMGMDVSHALKVRQGVFKNLRQQNTELESYTGDLEKVIDESTQDAQGQKTEIENNVNKVRGVIRFAKELSYQVAIEETLLLIRQELKKFHKINQCILAVENFDHRKKLYFYRGTTVKEIEVHEPWSGIQMIRINSLDDRKYLADSLSFPVGQVISVALNLTSGYRKVQQPVLYFEHSMSFEEIDQFVDFLSIRLQALSITIDRILLQSEVSDVTQMWESTFDSISDPIAIINRDYKTLRANQEFFKSPHRDHCFKSFADGEEVCEGCPIDKSIRLNTPTQGLLRMGDRNFEVHSYPIIERSTQTVTAVVNHYIDMTESNSMQGQILQNEKMSALGHLAGNIAHELNNPLTGIRSLTQILLQEDQMSEQLRGDLAEVEKASARCQGIIRNLLEFSSDDFAEQVEVVSVSELVEKTLPLLKTATAEFERHIELEDSGEDLVEIVPQLFQQVVFNLINNACHAMGDSGKLFINLESTSSSVNLSIRDTGPGIPDESLKMIFEPFYTTKTKGQGTGLGLSMCKRIIERFNGELLVESDFGEGAEFSVRLPKVKVQV